MCGSSREQAMRWLGHLEAITAIDMKKAPEKGPVATR
jgi:hypothetical protein